MSTTCMPKSNNPPSIQNEERSTSFPVEPHVLEKKNPILVKKSAWSKGKHIHVIRE